MAKQVTGWSSRDGALWETPEAAEIQDKLLEFSERYDGILGTEKLFAMGDSGFSSLRVDGNSLVEWIQKNGVFIQELIHFLEQKDLIGKELKPIRTRFGF